MKFDIEDMRRFANKHRGKNVLSGPHWATIIRFLILFDEYEKTITRAEAAEAGITTLEIALQPYILLPNGRTAGEWLAPQIEAAYQSGRMPALLLPGE